MFLAAADAARSALPAALFAYLTATLLASTGALLGVWHLVRR